MQVMEVKTMTLKLVCGVAKDCRPVGWQLMVEALKGCIFDCWLKTLLARIVE